MGLCSYFFHDALTSVVNCATIPFMQGRDKNGRLASSRIRFSKIAELAGVDRSTVTRWNNRKVPAERVFLVERLTGVSRHVLRPDLFPKDGP